MTRYPTLERAEEAYSELRQRVTEAIEWFEAKSVEPDEDGNIRTSVLKGLRRGLYEADKRIARLRAEQRTAAHYPAAPVDKLIKCARELLEQMSGHTHEEWLTTAVSAVRAAREPKL